MWLCELGDIAAKVYWSNIENWELRLGVLLVSFLISVKNAGLMVNDNDDAIMIIIIVVIALGQFSNSNSNVTPFSFLLYRWGLESKLPSSHGKHAVPGSAYACRCWRPFQVPASPTLAKATWAKATVIRDHADSSGPRLLQGEVWRGAAEMGEDGSSVCKAAVSWQSGWWVQVKGGCGSGLQVREGVICSVFWRIG